MSELDFEAFRLPSGRHGLSPKHVAESQRWRLLGAAAEVFADQGYLRTTSHGVAKRAAVSSSTLYEQFSGRDGCLLAAFEVCAVNLQTSFTEAAEAGRSLDTLVPASWRLFAGDPSLAALFRLELRAAVPAVAEAWDRLLDALVTAIGNRRRGSSSRNRGAALRLRLLVSAALTLLGSTSCTRVGRGDTTELAQLLDALT